MAVIDMKVLHSRWKLHVAPEDVSPNMRRIVGRSKSSLRRNDTTRWLPQSAARLRTTRAAINAAEPPGQIAIREK